MRLSAELREIRRLVAVWTGYAAAHPEDGSAKAVAAKWQREQARLERIEGEAKVGEAL